MLQWLHGYQQEHYSEATRAQGDEVAGADNEATEHDVSTAASADPNSESGALHTVEEADTEFDEMMDQAWKLFLKLCYDAISYCTAQKLVYIDLIIQFLKL